MYKVKCPLCGTKNDINKWKRKIDTVHYIQCPECWFAPKRYIQELVYSPDDPYASCFEELKYINKCIKLAKAIEDIFNVYKVDYDE